MTDRDNDMRSKRRDFLRLSVGAGAGALLPWIAPHARAATTIKLGALIPLSGSQATTGDLLKNGMQLAVDIANNRTSGVDLKMAQWDGIPGLQGAKVEVIWGDTRAQAAVGADLARRMIEDQKVVGLIGSYNSDVTAAVSTVAERMRVPMINAASALPSLTKRNLKYFFRVTPHQETFVDEAYRFLKGLQEGKSPGVPAMKGNRIAIAVETSEIGRLYAELNEQLAKRHGYEIIAAPVRFKMGSADLTSEIQALKALRPDILLAKMGVSDQILFTKTLKREGFVPGVYYVDNYGASDPNYVRTLGSDADNLLVHSSFSSKLLSKPITRQINDLFVKRTNLPLTDVPARAFTAMQVWMEILNKAGSTDADRLVKAAEAFVLPKEETIMHWDGVNFVNTNLGDTHQNALGSGLALQYQKGVGEIVWPFQLATAKLVYPFRFAG